jgi:transposase
MAYSMDLRERVVAALKQGESATQVAKRFCIATPTACDWRKRAEQGRLDADKPGPTGPRKITPLDDQILREQVAANPGIIAKDLMRKIRAEVVESTVDRRLIALGLRLKKSR